MSTPTTKKSREASPYGPLGSIRGRSEVAIPAARLDQQSDPSPIQPIVPANANDVMVPSDDMDVDCGQMQMDANTPRDRMDPQKSDVDDPPKRSHE